MNRSDIAWEHLSDIEKAQLIHFYPELNLEKTEDTNGQE